MDSSLDFLSNTADGAVAVDQEQRIIFWNAAAEKLLGFKAQEVLGRFCHEVINACAESGPSICQESCLKRIQSLEREAVPTRDVRVHTKTGQEVWVSLSTILFPSRQQDLNVLVHLFRDVTQQKELERSIQQLVTTVSKLSLEKERGLDLDKTPFLGSPNLTHRELEILRFLASGCTTKEIAHNLFITPATIRNHIHNVLVKCGVRTRLEAVILALRTGLLCLVMNELADNTMHAIRIVTSV